MASPTFLKERPVVLLLRLPPPRLLPPQNDTNLTLNQKQIMATDKVTVKKSLQTGLTPLLSSFREFIMTNAPNGVLGDNEPLHITFTLKREGVQTQGTLKFGRNLDGVCGWYDPDEYVGACLGT